MTNKELTQIKLEMYKMQLDLLNCEYDCLLSYSLNDEFNMQSRLKLKIIEYVQDRITDILKELKQ